MDFKETLRGLRIGRTVYVEGMEGPQSVTAFTFHSVWVRPEGQPEADSHKVDFSSVRLTAPEAPAA